jgi:hypothetical protein
MRSSSAKINEVRLTYGRCMNTTLMNTHYLVILMIPFTSVALFLLPVDRRQLRGPSVSVMLMYNSLLRFFYVLSWVLECFRYKQLISKLMSSMSHKANGLGRNRCRNKGRSLLLGNIRHRKISIFNVLREAKQRVASMFITELERVSRYCNC